MTGKLLTVIAILLFLLICSVWELRRVIIRVGEINKRPFNLTLSKESLRAIDELEARLRKIQSIAESFAFRYNIR